MGRRVGAMVAGLALAVGSAPAAQAAVRYVFTDPQVIFQYTTADFVSTFTTVGAGDLDQCVRPSGAVCDQVTFDFRTSNDVLYISFGSLVFSRFYPKGVLGQLGLHAGPAGSTLEVTDLSAAVPEPATWALMIGGFGVAGAGLRRRRAIA